MRTSNLKPLIAILSLPVFSFTAGQYLPYVITAISGSGVIAAVPLAIFAISAVVALISTIYLAKLVVSTINDKKKIDLNTVGRGVSVQTNNVSTQTTAITSTTPPALDQSTPTPPPLTLGTAIPQKPLTVAPPPPPSASVPPPPPPLPQGAALPSPSAMTSGLLDSIRNADGKPQKKRHNGSKGKQSGLIDELRKTQGGNAETETPEERAARIDRIVEENRKKNKDAKESNNNEQSNNHNLVLQSVMKNLRAAKALSDSESERSDDDSGWSENENKDKQKGTGQKKKVLTKHREKSTPQNSQPGSKKRSESPDSDYGSDDGVKFEPTSPSYSAPKVEKPPVPPKPAQAPPATTMTNETKEPHTSSVKELAANFGEIALRSQKQSIALGQR